MACKDPNINAKALEAMYEASRSPKAEYERVLALARLLWEKDGCPIGFIAYWNHAEHLCGVQVQPSVEVYGYE